MILSAIAAKLKQCAKADFQGRHFEVALIVQAVSWYLRYPLSYRDIEELFLERGVEVDHSTLNRWVLAYAPLIEKRLRQFRRPHCGSIRIDETYVKVRGEWRYLYPRLRRSSAPKRSHRTDALAGRCSRDRSRRLRHRAPAGRASRARRHRRTLEQRSCRGAGQPPETDQAQHVRQSRIRSPTPARPPCRVN